MSENRFSDCDTVQSVLWKFASRAYQSTFNEATTDALARIAELSPRTVDAAGREMAVIEITANQRGFHQYGEPVRTAYGDMVEVYESSSAEAPHCWLRIDGSTSALTDQKGRDMTAHLNREQAVAIRDRLNAWINEVPTRWGLKTSQPTLGDNTFSDCGNGAAVISTIAYMAATNGNDSIYAETIAAALARIAELTPRTVDEAGRERAREMLRSHYAYSKPYAEEVLDRIIDALGYTVAPHQCADVADDCCERTPAPATPVEPEARDRAISGAWLSGLMSWNIDTFGPGLRTEGVTDHIARELDEIRKAPTDLTEWADVILLALAGAVRAAGAEGEHPRRVIDAVFDKHQRNLQRQWPDWRTADQDKAIEHVRDAAPTPVSPPVVELDADDLRELADAIDGLDNYAGGLTIATNKDGAWVLRIGGGDE